MEKKKVTRKEMEMLLGLSHENEHPYYYRFWYSVSSHMFIARRIRKSSPFINNCERRSFHQIEIEPNDRIAKAIDTIEKEKEKIGAFSCS